MLIYIISFQVFGNNHLGNCIALQICPLFVNWKIYALVQKGILKHGRGVYSLGKTDEFTFEMSNKTKKAPQKKLDAHTNEISLIKHHHIYNFLPVPSKWSV